MDDVGKGDKPRKIIVCSTADYPAIQRGVAELQLGDVLVKPSRYVEDGQCYVIDGEWADGTIL